MTGLEGRYQLILEVTAPPPGNPPEEMGELTLQRFNQGVLRLGLRLERWTPGATLLS